MPLRQWRGPDERDLFEDALDKGRRARRVAGPVDPHAVFRPGELPRVRRRGNTVGPAELLPDRLEQPRLQQESHRPKGQNVRIVVLERPGQHDCDLALRREAFLYRLFDDACRPGDAEVAPGLVRARGRQAGDVRLDERLDGLRREAADEDEREVARVGESRLVERQRRREIPLVHRCGCLRLPPEIVSAERGVDRLIEYDVGARHLVREQGPRLRRD